MWLNELCKQWTRRTTIGRKPHAALLRRRGLRPALEQLEDRTVLSAGLAADTVLVEDINPGSEHSIISYMADLNGTLLLDVAGVTNFGLWKSNGTETGTSFLATAYPEGPFTVVGNTAFFAATDGTTGV